MELLPTDLCGICSQNSLQEARFGALALDAKSVDNETHMYDESSRNDMKIDF